jgi:hypothetical protein
VGPYIHAAAAMAFPYTMTSVGGATHSYDNDCNIAAIGSNHIGIAATACERSQVKNHPTNARPTATLPAICLGAALAQNANRQMERKWPAHMVVTPYAGHGHWLGARS